MKANFFLRLIVIASISFLSMNLISCVAAIEHNTNMTIGPLFQVILNVKSIKNQTDFYMHILGLELVNPPTVNEIGPESFVRLKSKNGAYLALHPTNDSIGIHPSRLSFLTDDIEKARKYLDQHGIHIGRTRSPVPGILILDLKDPENNTVHIEYHENRPKLH